MEKNFFWGIQHVKEIKALSFKKNNNKYTEICSFDLCTQKLSTIGTLAGCDTTEQLRRGQDGPNRIFREALKFATNPKDANNILGRDRRSIIKSIDELGRGVCMK